MLQNWLKPLSATFLKHHAEPLPAGTLGKNLLLHSAQQVPDLKRVKAALIGVGEKEANDIRAALYRSAWPFPEGSVADLGNLRRTDAALLIPVLYELLSGKVLPIVLCHDDDLARAQFLAYQEAKGVVNLTVVDERMRFGHPAAAYTPVLKPRHPMLLHFSLVGYQIHQVPPEAALYLSQFNFDTLRLGRTRAAIEEVEPVLRDADLLCFHLAALKQSEAPGVLNASPSGFTTEEACQLCRYAGMSDKLSSFGVYGFHRDADRDAQTAQVAAQMVWYFLEGVFARKGDYPAATTGLTEYIVDFRKLNYQLTFWKSTRSGRWWMQVPVATQRQHERHRLVPCSYQDYQSACREELPERLVQALQRF
ncbi:MAG TPA: arginase family protein [Saprospiraceae bacterium]|nr:arginase family protein [Saprospiraceae bacterium]HND87356.1 arginase family protein [Saprospiraceae bacterium]HNG90098.1 arginase family protein [Saprospiraceae bacterium]